MSYIYPPKGKAQEFVESSPDANDGLALNLYHGCDHKCAYCYVPTLPPFKFEGSEFHEDQKLTARELFHSGAHSRDGIVKGLIKECERAKPAQKAKILLLCFTCDPYPMEPEHDITRTCLDILAHYQFRNVTILTKGGTRACDDFDILQRNFWSFGTTAVATSDDWLSYPDCEHCPSKVDPRICPECNGPRAGLEPYAASFYDRLEAIRKAREMGIRTWVSLEPVIEPSEALRVIEALKDYVDLWKVGKLNHGAKISTLMGQYERTANWRKFCKDARAALAGKRVYWKKSLQPFMD